MTKYSPFLTVLIVDDEPLIRWALVETLTSAGHKTIEAGDGAAAIRAAASPTAIDVILLDFRLPDSNGVELLVALKCLRSDTAVIMMTAHDDPEVLKEALRLGAHRVLKKPFDMRDVPAVVARAHACRAI